MSRRIIVAGAIVLTALVLGGIFLSRSPREKIAYDDPARTSRPLVRAQEFVVTTGMPLATHAAITVLEDGGNAFDAAVASLLVLNVVFGDAASFPGIAPILIYDVQASRVLSYTGAGTAPTLATVEEYARRGYTTTVPDLSILSQLIPASPDVIVALLKDHGSRSFGELATDAIRNAREGFPVHHIMAQNLDLSLLERIGFSYLMPYTASVFLQGQPWRSIQYGDRFRRPDLARTLEELAAAERRALDRGASRAEALDALRHYFYEGPIAEKILALHEAQDGFFTREDLAQYHGTWEEPLRISIQLPSGAYEIYTNGTWTQGAALLMMLKTVETFGPERLRALGHNTSEYIHTLVQIIDLAMADRDAYLGDPRFVDVPLKELFGVEHARQQLQRLTPRAFAGPPGAAELIRNGTHREPLRPDSPHVQSPIERVFAWRRAPGKDTSYIAIIDSAGNAVSLTPSDFPKSPMVPGTGLNLGNRMIQFRLDPHSPNVVAPGKRPRVTPHALMAFRGGEFYMSFGTPGGDMQTQANLQFLLNHALFGMDAQQATEAPRFRSRNFPDSFAPHSFRASGIDLEAALFEVHAEALMDRGYQVEAYSKWANHFGGVGAVLRRGDDLFGAADPREGTLAEGR